MYLLSNTLSTASLVDLRRGNATLASGSLEAVRASSEVRHAVAPTALGVTGAAQASLLCAALFVDEGDFEFVGEVDAVVGDLDGKLGADYRERLDWEFGAGE